MDVCQRLFPYREIIAISKDPQNVDLARPVSRFEPTVVREKDGKESSLQTFTHHLLCDDDGNYPAELRDGEMKVLNREMEREGFLHWYRNPKRTTQESIGVAYRFDDDCRIMHPNFVFFSEEYGNVAVDIVDPHGHFLADTLPKLVGLYDYAEAHASLYRRIEAVDVVSGKFRVLDLKKQEVRDAVRTATSAKSLYESAVAGDYK